LALFRRGSPENMRKQDPYGRKKEKKGGQDALRE